MKKIFISWSKKRSEEFAKIVKSTIEKLDSDIDVFMSEEDIKAGEFVQEKIISNIENCDILILCFTTENKRSPWLLYEAGYASGLHKVVIPFLFDNDSMWHSWIDNPMNIAREISFCHGDLLKDFTEIFLLKGNLTNQHIIENFKKEIGLCKEQFRDIDIQCEDLVEKLSSIDKFTITSPIFREKTAYFLSGFETFELWKTIIQSFLYTGKYLWIYGRKNMKLFGGNFNELFQYLDEKSMMPNMDGIDFKLMFLNPDSDEVNFAHKDQDIFKSELRTTMLRAKKIIGTNTVLQKCCRLYSNKRDEIIIRIDNSIIYCKPHFDIKGNPNIMTNAAFEVFSVFSKKGQHCVQKYMDVWNKAINMF